MLTNLSMVTQLIKSQFEIRRDPLVAEHVCITTFLHISPPILKYFISLLILVMITHVVIMVVVVM